MENSVKLVQGICPKCGAQLELDPTQEAAVCQYCGTPFVVDKAVSKYNVEHAHIDHVDSVNVDLKGSVDSVVGMVERLADKSREDNRENRLIQAENQKEFLRNAWKIFAVMFLAAIIIFVLDHFLNFM